MSVSILNGGIIRAGLLYKLSKERAWGLRPGKRGRKRWVLLETTCTSDCCPTFRQIIFVPLWIMQIFSLLFQMRFCKVFLRHALGYDIKLPILVSKIYEKDKIKNSYSDENNDFVFQCLAIMETNKLNELNPFQTAWPTYSGLYQKFFTYISIFENFRCCGWFTSL